MYEIHAREPTRHPERSGRREIGPAIGRSTEEVSSVERADETGLPADPEFRAAFV